MEQTLNSEENIKLKLYEKLLEEKTKKIEELELELSKPKIHGDFLDELELNILTQNYQKDKKIDNLMFLWSKLTHENNKLQKHNKKLIDDLQKNKEMVKEEYLKLLNLIKNVHFDNKLFKELLEKIKIILGKKQEEYNDEIPLNTEKINTPDLDKEKISNLIIHLHTHIHNELENFKKILDYIIKSLVEMLNGNVSQIIGKLEKKIIQMEDEI